MKLFLIGIFWAVLGASAVTLFPGSMYHYITGHGIAICGCACAILATWREVLKK